MMLTLLLLFSATLYLYKSYNSCRGILFRLRKRNTRLFGFSASNGIPPLSLLHFTTPTLISHCFFFFLVCFYFVLIWWDCLFLVRRDVQKYFCGGLFFHLWVYGTMDLAVPAAVNVLMTMGLDPTLATLSLSNCCPSLSTAPSLLAPPLATTALYTPVNTCTQPIRLLVVLSRIFFFSRSHCYHTITFFCVFWRIEKENGRLCPPQLLGATLY